MVADEFDHRERYACAQSYANAIWSRSKWQTPAGRYLKTGDYAWVLEETNPEVYYPTAWITELHNGSDSVALYAVLHTSSGSLVRPLVNLIPILPTSSGPEDVTKQKKSKLEKNNQSESSI